MVKYVFCNDMFHNFTTDTSERDWSVIYCVVFFTFVVCWCNICMFPVRWYALPVWSDFLKMMVKIGAIKFWRSFSILPLMLSGPLALCGLMLLSSFLDARCCDGEWWYSWMWTHALVRNVIYWFSGKYRFKLFV